MPAWYSIRNLSFIAQLVLAWWFSIRQRESAMTTTRNELELYCFLKSHHDSKLILQDELFRNRTVSQMSARCAAVLCWRAVPLSDPSVWGRSASQRRIVEVT